MRICVTLKHTRLWHFPRIPFHFRGRTLTLRIHIFSQLQRVGVCEVGVGWGDSQNQTVLARDELHNHFSDLMLDVGWLVPHGHFRNSR